MEVSVVTLSHTHTHTHTHTQLNRFCVGMFLKIEDSKGALWLCRTFGSVWYAGKKKYGVCRGRSYLAEKEQCGLVR